MSRSLLIAALIVMFFAPREADAQARRIVLFEHFTNASCGPCASQNPVFRDSILRKNNGNMIHIAYHTVWPGRDPMNAFNKEDVAARVSYYGVTGVPDMVMLGGQYRGGPAGVTQDVLNRASANSSPLRIRLRESTNGTTRNVDVDVTTLGQIDPTGLVIRGAVVESNISYATAPGTNGEKEFENVFRRFINTPAGEAFSPAVLGQTTSLSFEYELDATWDASKIYTAVWIQHNSTKEVINASTSFIPAIELVLEGESFTKGAPQQKGTFQLSVQNLGPVDQNVRLSLVSAQAADWTSSFIVNGTPASGDVEILVPASGMIPLSIDVTPGNSAGLGDYDVTMVTVDNPEFTPQHAMMNTISNVTDLLVHNDNGWGSPDGTVAKDFETAYLNGLNSTGSTTIAATSGTLFLRGWNLGKLDDVKYVFYNAGWAFPGLSSELVASFTELLSNGGNLFVSGQDVGWDTFDPNGRGTSATQTFYRNYLFSTYISDGAIANSNVTLVNTDPLYGQLGSFRLINVYGNNTSGQPLFYPDNIRPTFYGVAVAYYGSDASAGAMIRGARNNYKTVNCGFGMEQVVEPAIRDEIMKLTWQWFHGIISSVDFDGAVASLTLGQNYPNPASDATVIPLEASTRDRTLQVYDINGKLMLTHEVASGSTQLRLDATHLRPGVYTYRLLDGGRVVGGNIMQVVR